MIDGAFFKSLVETISAGRWANRKPRRHSFLSGGPKNHMVSPETIFGLGKGPKNMYLTKY